MKILLAPSETKKIGGNGKFNLNSLFLSDINKSRELLIKEYLNIVLNADLKTLSKMFGLKKENDIRKHIKDITKEPTLKAIQRYTGVAFDYLNYDSLKEHSKKYLDNNLLIFSNLFGIVKANDLIPNYRLKQGEMVTDIRVEKHFNKVLKEPLDNYLKNEDILDLRAKYYEKFYKPNKKYTTLKFLKDTKVVSHWAKAYRGMILRECAVNRIKSIDDFLRLDFKTLEVKEIIEKKAYNEIIYNIIE